MFQISINETVPGSSRGRANQKKEFRSGRADAVAGEIEKTNCTNSLPN
jgi:hypothetical protein